MGNIDNIIKKSINEVIHEIVSEDNVIVEGVKYNKTDNSFIFDFLNDSETDIIRLSNSGLHKSELYNNCYYYKYQFENDVDTATRRKFIEYIKFHKNMKDEDISTFIKKAINSLDDTVKLRTFNTVIYPQSMSEINREMLSYLRMFGYPDFLPFEMVKIPPSEMIFDYESYKRQVLDATHQIGGKVLNNYSDSQKKEELSKIENLMSELKKQDYFSMGKDVKVKYRNYLHNIYKFNTDNERICFEKIMKPKVLIIDDVKTSGVSLNFVIDTVSKVNPRAKIVVFSLIGKD